EIGRARRLRATTVLAAVGAAERTARVDARPVTANAPVAAIGAEAVAMTAARKHAYCKQVAQPHCPVLRPTGSLAWCGSAACDHFVTRRVRGRLLCVGAAAEADLVE